MNKNYRKIELKQDITINEMVLILMEHATKGEFVCTEFEGHKFYSDTISINSAYLKVYGKSYYDIMAPENIVADAEKMETGVSKESMAEGKQEIDAESAITTATLAKVEAAMEIEASAVVSEEEAEQEGETEETEPEIPISEYEKQGRERINEKYWLAWSKCVELYEGNEEKEKDLDICLSIIGAIDENDLQLEKAMSIVWNLECSKEKLYEILDVLEMFGDKGYYISKKARSARGFKKVNSSGDANYSIYIDKDTRCQYLWVKNGSAGGLELIVNVDGTPKLYEGDMDL